jgi:hypothetical protein
MDMYTLAAIYGCEPSRTSSPTRPHLASHLLHPHLYPYASAIFAPSACHLWVFSSHLKFFYLIASNVWTHEVLNIDKKN